MSVVLFSDFKFQRRISLNKEVENNEDKISDELTKEIKSLILDARNNLSKEINRNLINTYWNVGKVIVEKEQEGKIKAEYGKTILLTVANKLKKEIGMGFSKSNLFNMRKFYLTYPKIPDMSGILGWSHYCELISIREETKRQIYEKEAVNSKWSVRELKRQIETSLFERLLLSDGKNKHILYTKPRRTHKTGGTNNKRRKG